MTMPRIPKILVPDVRAAAAWYARVFDLDVEDVDDKSARVNRDNGIPLELELGTPNPHPSTPVLEMVVEDLPSWLAPALAEGATRMTPESLQGYAQFRDPWGYVWALLDRAKIPPRK